MWGSFINSGIYLINKIYHIESEKKILLTGASGTIGFEVFNNQDKKWMDHFFNSDK
jgi:FlaA1/EpsC-like NDP-sugar epimerase